MAGPPTVATSTSSALLTGLGVNSRFSTTPDAFAYTPGPIEYYVSQYRRQRPATRSVSFGKEINGCWRVWRRCNAAKVGFQVLGSTSNYRFIVGDQYVSAAGTVTA